ncbi:MAG: hypothetical protein ABI652_06530 [Acidobacteriota bacterium]
MKLRTVGIFAMIAVITAAALQAAQAPQSPAAPQTVDLSGIWNRLDTVGGGSYGGISANFPQAELKPEYAALLPALLFDDSPPAPPPGAPHAPGVPYLTTDALAVVANGGQIGSGRCGIGGGGGGVDINSSGMALMQNKDEVVLVRDGSAGGRHIYLDGRAHPDPSRTVPSASGHSIGHWENGTLVVETVGLTAGLLGFGHGYRTPATVLTEAFKLTADGKRLTVTYTWTDPKVYVKPHVYEISFERQDGYLFENWCDASVPHPENDLSIVPPVQLPDK